MNNNHISRTFIFYDRFISHSPVNNISYFENCTNYNSDCVDEERFLSYLKTNNENLVIFAYGGIGKSYIAKRWVKKNSEIKNYELFHAKDLTRNKIKDQIIIDGFDEISFEDSQKILVWIIDSKFEKIIIFSRPETEQLFSNFFNKIFMQNKHNVNPRYNELEIGNGSYKSWNNLFLKRLKLNRSFVDFLSILSMHLLTRGVISIDTNELFEFLRKYNLKNNTSFTIEELFDCKELKVKKFSIFEEVDSQVAFLNKSIPSFFVIKFFEKFAHKKNSYLSYFGNYASQAVFSESARILKTEYDDASIKIIWNLISKNNFFFVFLDKLESAFGLEDFFSHKVNDLSKEQFTELLKKIQANCSNDKDFNGSINFSSEKIAFLKRIDLNKFLIGILNEIESIESRKRAFEYFLLWVHWLILENPKNSKKIHNQVIQFLSDGFVQESIKNFLTTFQDFDVLEYIFNLRMLDKIRKEKYYSNYASMMYSNLHWVEDAIRHLLYIEEFEKAFELISNFNFRTWTTCKNFQYVKKFFTWIVKSGKISNSISLLRSFYLAPKQNEQIIQKILKKNRNLLISNELMNQTPYFRKIEVTDKFKTFLINTELSESQFDYLFILRDKNWFGQTSNNSDSRNYIIGNVEEILSIFQKKNIYDSGTFFQKYFLNNSNNKKFEFKGNIEQEKVDEILNKVNDIHKNYGVNKQYFLDENSYFYCPTYWIIVFFCYFEQINLDKLSPIIMLNIWSKRRKLLYLFPLNKKIHINNLILYFENKITIWLKEFRNFQLPFEKNKTLVIKGNLLVSILKAMSLEDIHKALNLLIKLPWKNDQESLYPIYLEVTKSLEVNKSKEFLKKVVCKMEESTNIDMIEGFIHRPAQLKLWSEYSKNKNQKFQKYLKSFLDEISLTNISIYKYFEFRRSANEVDLLWKKFYGIFKWTNNSSLLDKFCLDFIKKIWSLRTNVSSQDEYNVYDKMILKCAQIKSNSNLEQKNKIDKIINKKPKNEFQSLFKNRFFWIHERYFPQNKRLFCLSGFYDYLDGQMTLKEFAKLFEEEIIPLISKIGKEATANCYTRIETIVHTELNNKLPTTLMSKYRIIYQTESNPYSKDDFKSRVDFILSFKDLRIIVELKSNTSISTNKKLKEQLKKYNPSYEIQNKKFLIVFCKTDSLSENRKKELKDSASSFQFKTFFLKI